MTDDLNPGDEPKKMFPGGWKIDRRPTLEMRMPRNGPEDLQAGLTAEQA